MTEGEPIRSVLGDDLSIDRRKRSGRIRILNWLSLTSVCVALFFLVADLGEPIDLTRLGAEIAMIIAATGLLAWGRAKQRLS